MAGADEAIAAKRPWPETRFALNRRSSAVQLRSLKLDGSNSTVPLSEPHAAALLLRPLAMLSAQPDDTKVHATCSRFVFAMPAFCGDGGGLKGR